MGLGVLLMGIRAYDLVSDRAYILAGEDVLFGAGLSKSYPKNAAEFILREQLPGNIFNDYDLGGYLVFRHYHGILSAGGHAAGSARRKAYDDLRASLSTGGTPALLYAKWLEKALHFVEQFFGEVRAAGRSTLHQVIGLNQPA